MTLLKVETMWLVVEICSITKNGGVKTERRFSLWIYKVQKKYKNRNESHIWCSNILSFWIFIMGMCQYWGKAMANYPHELAQDAVCHSRTGHMTGIWFRPTRPLRLNANEWMMFQYKKRLTTLKYLNYSYFNLFRSSSA